MPETQDYAEECDYNSLRNRIINVLRRYYAADDAGNPNPTYSSGYAATQAVDDIHEIIGTI